MIYIQSNTERIRPHHFDVACAQFGAIENCMDWRLTSFEEVQSNKFNTLIPNNLFVGSVEFMKEVFSKVGLNPKLPRNSNRDFILTTLSEVRNNNRKVFIKPVDIKLFTGFVFDTINRTSISNIPDDTVVMQYEVLPRIISEWRCYIHYNKVIDIKNYSGDFFKVPNKEYLESIIEENKNFPIAYTIDIGILENGENIVVEFNDMWAIGNYGIPNDDYLRLLKDRYFEIIRNVKPLVTW